MFIVFFKFVKVLCPIKKYLTKIRIYLEFSFQELVSGLCFHFKRYQDFNFRFKTKEIFGD